MVTVRFMDHATKKSASFGPYPFVQLTYTLLRVGPEGEDLAYLVEKGAYRDHWFIEETKEYYSDVVVRAQEDPGRAAPV